MERLPEKEVRNCDCIYKADILDSRIVGKLGKLEDFEEELGIDLITFLNALKNGVYAEVLDTKCFYTINKISFKSKFFECINEIGLIIYINFNDYRKTWALTKEELEKGE